MSETTVRGVIELREKISESMAKAKSATESFTQTAAALKKQLDELERNRKKLIDAGESAQEIKKIDAKIGDLKRKAALPAKMQVDADTTKAKNEVDKLKGFIAKAVAGLAIGAATVTAFKAGIEYNASMEQSAISWNTILRDEQAAAVTMKQLVDMAAKTPYSFMELDGVAKKLNMAGFSGQELFTTLTNVGDAVSAIGGDNETLNGVATALYQIYTKGKLSAEEMLQLGERGIPAWEILAGKMGMTAAELQKLTSDGEVMAKDILPLLSEGLGERFGGSMAAQSKTMKGMLNTTRDLKDQLLSIGTQGAFDALKGGLEGVNRELSSDAAKRFAADVGAGVGKAVQFFVDFAKQAYKAKEAIVIAGAAFAGYFLGSKIANGIETVVGGVKALVTGLKGAKVAQEGLNKASMASGWGIAAAAIGAAAAALMVFYKKSREHIEEFKEQSEAATAAFDDLKRATQNEKLKIETDFSRAKQEIDEIKGMIDREEWGEGLDRKVNTLLEKCPELAGAIVESGTGWKIHSNELDSIFEKMQRNAEYAFLQSEMDKYTEQVNTYNSSEEKERRAPMIAELEKQERELQSNIDTLSMPGITADMREGLTLSIPQLEKNIAELKEPLDAERKAYEDALRYLNETKEKVKALDAPDPVVEQTPQQSTDTRIIGEVNTRNDAIIEKYAVEQRTLTAHQENMDRGTTEALENVARALGVEREKGESDKSHRKNVQGELDKVQLELDNSLITDLEASARQGIVDGGSEMSASVRTTLSAGANQIASCISSSLSVLKSGVDVRVKVTDAGRISVEETDTPRPKTSGTKTQDSDEFAMGTNYAPGGRALVGEQGAEIVDLPKGSRVTPAHKTSQMLAQPGGINLTVNLGGVTVREDADIDRIAAALVRKLEVVALGI